MEILLKKSEKEIWETLPDQCKNSIAEKAIEAILSGKLYPCGTEQLELALFLAENNVEKQVISKITRLNSEIFEGMYSNPAK